MREPARDALSLALSRERPAVGAALAEGARLLEGRDPAAAASALDGAIGAGARTHWPYLLRARARDELGWVEEAAQDAGEALRLGGPEAELLALRGRLRLNRREYARAFEDLSRAARAAPRDARLRAARAECLALMDRPREALRDLSRALRLSPGDSWLRLQRARLFLELRRAAALEADLARLSRAPEQDARLEALFLRGCRDLQRGRFRSARRRLARAQDARPHDSPFSLKARFYRTAAAAVDPSLLRRFAMDRRVPTTPTLYLCGLGIFPPYTATLEVLHAVSRCQVAFNNVAGPEVRALLAEYCADVRHAAYQASEDEERWADRILRELKKGKSVAFVTRGHPLVFGGLAVELVARCRREGVAFHAFGAVSSIDHLLAAEGLGLGEDVAGVQAFDRPALEKARAVDTRQPLIACFYHGLKGRARVEAFTRSLRRFYPAEHGCRMFGPKYDSPAAELALGELARRYPEIHPSLMLYLPPLQGQARRTRR